MLSVNGLNVRRRLIIMILDSSLLMSIEIIMLISEGLFEVS
jgi:hypothetical protein